ncbi:pseudouridine synthase [Persephonella sp.]
MFNKPSGCITAVADSSYKTVMDYFSDVPFKSKLFPVGRLDIDTEGLLIVTTDGIFSHRLTHPKWEIEKEYFVVVDGDVSSVDFKDFEKEGIYLKKYKYKTRPFSVEVVKTSGNSSQLKITVTEGKFHIIKRIMETLRFNVIYLKRLRIGTLSLDESLEAGCFRELRENEIISLKKLVKMV